jgi:enterochelin esterase-like enzyme
LFAFASDRWEGGEYGTDAYELWKYRSKMGVTAFKSPSLGKWIRFGLYLPPGYSRSRTTYYPVLYLMGGYNMSVAGLANSYVKSALDLMILSGEIQKMIIVIPDGTNYKNKRGHFFVNQIDLERGDRFMDYFFELVNFIDSRLQTK